MGAWSPDSKSHVAHMDGDDFYGSEQSHVVPFDIKESSTHKDAGVVRIEFVGEYGSTNPQEQDALQPGEVRCFQNDVVRDFTADRRRQAASCSRYT